MRAAFAAVVLAFATFALPTAVAPGCAGTVTPALGNYLVTDGLDEYVYAESNGIADLQRGGVDGPGLFPVTCRATLTDAPATVWWVVVCIP